MAKNTNRRKKDIKSKLIAAICMLLVSTIMMVSSTYAWFTLSTAPEVQGITTQIGSNGALEIALSPATGEGSDVKDYALGGSTLWSAKNLTWGNLLNLGIDEDNDKANDYGLDTLVLSPARLMATVTDGATYLSDTPLATPVYGPDGRIESLAKNTDIGGWNGSAYIVGGGDYGVRAVGSSSSMGPLAAAKNAALSNIRTKASLASTSAGESIYMNGEALVGLIVKRAMNSSDTLNYADQEHLDALRTLTSELDESVTAMKDAVKEILYAGLTSVDANLTEDAYNVLVSAIKTADWATLKNIISGSDTSNGTVPTSIKNALMSGDATNPGLIERIDAIDLILNGTDGEGGIVAQANELPETVVADDTTTEDVDEATVVYWSQISPILNALINTSSKNVLVAGQTVADLKASLMKDGKYDVAAASGLLNGCTIELGDGSGIYYDIAVIAGNITATIKEATVDLSAVNEILGETQMTNIMIKTSYTGTALLLNARSVMSNLDVNEATGGATALDTYYGYVVDLMFRTNAADSNLLLQSDAAQRVYGDDYLNGASTNEETMGNGAMFKFTDISDADKGSVTGLLECMRVVFFDTSSKQIYGVAMAPAISTVERDETDKDGNAIKVYDISGTLRLYNYSVNDAGEVVLGSMKESDVLCALDQNTVKAVSCLVYLDGDNVTNADVLADTNVISALNLQFASDADLQPMANTDLYNGGNTGSDTEEDDDTTSGDNTDDNTTSGGEEAGGEEAGGTEGTE